MQFFLRGGLRRLPVFFAMVALLCFASYGGAWSQTFHSGSTGSDGILNVTQDMVIDMTDHPMGVYNYVSVSISEGKNLTFLPNEKNTPLVWLVNGDVTIKGIINIAGKAGRNGSDNMAIVPGYESLGGPGGFQGGLGGVTSGTMDGSNGHGPGGGVITTGVGGNASSSYISQYGLPLIGGSGGAGGKGRVSANGGSGGGGGGAILIAADGTINIVFWTDDYYGPGSLRGYINAGAGSGGTSLASAGGAGSGGTIRLIATAIKSNVGYNSGGYSMLYAHVARLEAFSIQFQGPYTCTVFTSGTPGVLDLPGNPPSLEFANIAGEAVPASPHGVSATPDVTFSSDDVVSLSLAAHNIPVGATVTVKAIPHVGQAIIGSATLEGTTENSAATLDLAIPKGSGVLEAYTRYNLNLPPFSSVEIEGEKVVSVQAEIDKDGRSRTFYVTESGKKIDVSIQK